MHSVFGSNGTTFVNVLFNCCSYRFYASCNLCCLTSPLSGSPTCPAKLGLTVDLWVVQLWTMTGRDITRSVASLPSKTQQEFMEQFLFYLAWWWLCSLSQAWATQQLSSPVWSFKVRKKELLSACCGHSESLKVPHFLGAYHANVDCLRCRLGV